MTNDFKIDTEEQNAEASLKILSGISPGDGFKLSIFRVRPSFVSTGWIETVDFGPDTDFSPEWLREAHGGGHYNLRVLNSKGEFVKSTTLKIAGDPIINGRIVTHQSTQLNENQSNIQKKPDDTANVMRLVLENLMSSQKANTDLLISMMNKASTGEPANPIDQIKGILGLITEIKSSADIPAADDNGIASIANLISSLIATKAAQQQQQQQPQRRVVLTPMVKPVIPTANPSTVEQLATAPVINPNKNDSNSKIEDDLSEDESELSLLDEVLEMPIEDLKDFVREIMERLPAEKLAKIAEAFSKDE